MACFRVIIWFVYGLLYGLFYGHIICNIWPRRLRVLLLDYVMTCLVVVVR